MDNYIITRLPMKKSNKHKDMVIDWTKLEDNYIEMYYEGEVVILYVKKYDPKKAELQIRLKDSEESKNKYINISSSSLKKCRIANLLKERFVSDYNWNNCCFSIAYDENFKQLNLKKDAIENLTISCSTKLIFRCNKSKHLFTSSPNKIFQLRDSKNKGCPICSNKIIIKDYNSVYKTNPDLNVYYKNIEDSYSVTNGSHKKVELLCPNCKSTHIQSVEKLVKRGFKCKNCSDGTSYSEKFVYNLLKALNAEYNREYMFKGVKRKYDFYIPSLNMIIETHGIQHYEESFKNGTSRQRRTLKEEQENDKFKRELALSNGIEHYIELDCRKSELEWIKNSILNSKLAELFDLSNIDWEGIGISAQKSSLLIVCKEFNKGLSVNEISVKYAFGKTTIRRWLYKGNSFGLCKYNL